MKILLISNGDFFSIYGGGQVYVSNLVNEMIRQGIAVVVFSFVEKTIQGIEKKNYKGIDLYEILGANDDEIKLLLKLISPDVVHAHSQKARFSIICKELSIPYTVTAHHGGITCPAGSLLNHKDEICHVCANDKDCLPCVMKNTRWGYPFAYSWMKFIPFPIRLKLGLRLKKIPFIYFITPLGSATLQIQEKKNEWKTIADNVDWMIAPSKAIAENMVLNGLNPDKIRVIPHGIPIYETPETPFIVHEKLKFFYVGRICYVKGIHVLLKAFENLDESLCELHLIGDIKGKYERDLVKKYKKKRNLFFHGKVFPENVYSKIKEYDVLVHSTICLEVFGLNIAEALSQGKPVIATCCGGAEMQIKDRRNGLFVEPNNVLELRNAMEWMVNHLEEVRKMSVNAPQAIVSISEHVSALVGIYNALLLYKK